MYSLVWFGEMLYFGLLSQKLLILLFFFNFKSISEIMILKITNNLSQIEMQMELYKQTSKLIFNTGSNYKL